MFDLVKPSIAGAIVAAGKDRLDLSVGIAFGSAAQIALFVAPALTLASYFIGPAPMDLSFTRGQVSAVFTAMLTAALVANSGKIDLVHGYADDRRVHGLRYYAVPAAHVTERVQRSGFRVGLVQCATMSSAAKNTRFGRAFLPTM